MAETIMKKTFTQLTPTELYEILDLRMKIFIEEQHIIYVDTDYKDQDCDHYFIKKDGKIVSYLRFLPAHITDMNALSFGRLVTDQNYRHQGLASTLIKQVLADHKGEKFMIHAQAYLKDYYASFGFQVVSAPFIEEDVWHFLMAYDNLA